MVIQSRWRYKYNYLTGHGFLPFESREIARQYTMVQIRKLPYLRNMIRSRGLTIRKFRKQGFGNAEIRDRIYAFYDANDLLVNGRPDIWSLIRRYRKDVISSGGTASPGLPPRRKGSHHKGGISKGNLTAQRQRRRKRTFLEKYEEKQGR